MPLTICSTRSLESLFDYIEATVEEINRTFLGYNITLTEDFNQLLRQ